MLRKKVLPKKRRRLATGRDPVTAIRLSPEFRARVEGWAAKQPDQPGRSEAIRQLVEIGLSTISSPRRRSRRSHAKSAELANEAIERHVYPAASREARESRKRQLLKGPKEFRGIRKDHPD